MQFDGFPKYLAAAARAAGISRVDADGQPNLDGGRVLDLAIQPNGMRAVGIALGQAADGRNHHRLASLAIARQHAKAMELAATAARLMVEDVQRAIEQEEQNAVDVELHAVSSKYTEPVVFEPEPKQQKRR